MKNFLLVLIGTTALGFLLGIFFFNLPQISSLQVPEDISLELSLTQQSVGTFWINPIKYAIRGAVASGVSAQTISFLLLLPVVTAFIAGVRHLIGIRSFGIFLPAALSVVFIVIGPFFGIALFLLIMTVATLVRILFRSLKIHLQYLPRMSLILWAVVVCVLIVLYLAPVFGGIDFQSVSVLPLFILILLAEDFIRVQLGKSVKTAITLTSETLALALISFLILSFLPLERFAILNPEVLLISVALFDFVLGKYTGLRFIEFWRFRKLIKN